MADKESKPPSQKQDLVVFRTESTGLEIRWTKTFAMALFDFKSTVSPESWKTYDVALRSFFGFLGQIGVTDPEAVTTTHITSYIDLLRGQKKATRTIRCYVAAGSSFFDFLMRPRDTKGTSLIKSNPFLSVKESLPKIQAYIKENPLPELTLAQYEAILGTTTSETIIDLRDRAILSLIFWTTRRRKEIVRLKVEDFGNDRGTPWVRFLTKGGKYLSIDLSPGIQAAIDVYWKSSGREMGPKSPAFAATTDAGRHLQKAHNLRVTAGKEKQMATSSIDRMLKSRASQAGIDATEVHVHVHGLRHLAARTLRERGIDLKEIKERLGHSRLDTTDIYLGAMERLKTTGLEEFERIALGRPPGPLPAAVVPKKD